jgi:hypothetical protein
MTAKAACRRWSQTESTEPPEPNRASAQAKPTMRQNNLFGATWTAIPTAKGWRHIGGYLRGHTTSQVALRDE